MVAGRVVAAADAESVARRAAETFFETRVRPVLAKHCIACHGAKKQERRLRLDSRRGILRGGERGTRVVQPGQPEKSLLVEAIGYRGEIQMPPDGQLTEQQVHDLTEWVRLGLPWPGGSGELRPVDAVETRLDAARRSHWSLQPISRRTPRVDPRHGWVATEIDAWIAGRLDQAHLTPSPPADRRTWIRRVTYDLTGLPPTAEQVATFLGDGAPDAYQRLVDRLLASPHYGERWGRHWLDVARYADTRGYAFGRERRYPYAYTYRDYVIRAMNEDLPYNRFVVEQLAADRLDDLDGKWHLAAMGLLTVGRRFNNPHDDIDDQIDVVTRGLLGLTVGCARCHDHKYDPIKTDDYYSLYGIFASSREPNDRPLITDAEASPGYARFKAELAKRRAALARYRAERLVALIDTSRRRVTDYLVRVVSDQPEVLLQKEVMLSLSGEELKPRLVERWRRFLDKRATATDRVFGPWRALVGLANDRFVAEAPGVIAGWGDADSRRINGLVRQRLTAAPIASKIALAQCYGHLLEDVYAVWKEAGGNREALGTLSDDQREVARLLLAEGTPTAISDAMLSGYLSRQEGATLRALQKKIDRLEVESPAAPARAMVLVDRPKPHDARVLIRGNPSRPGRRVPRRFLQVLGGDARQPFTNGSGRLELARAIVAPDNPLTARVLVNRMWMHHLAEPLVRTPSDFGLRCDPPSHPELLDALARFLMDHRWSLKRLHRWIVCSYVYGQSSLDRPACRGIDPENRLLWRMNRTRLEFEPIRDTLLAVAGNLDMSVGGKPMDWSHGVTGRRRAVYGLVDRQDLPNLLRTFDFASPDQSAARRTTTMVPAQALFLMNSPFVVRQAKAVAARVLRMAGTEPAERIEVMYRIVLGRPPTPVEREVGQRFVAAANGEDVPVGEGDRRADRKPSPGDPRTVGTHLWQQYAQMLLMTNELMFID